MPKPGSPEWKARRAQIFTDELKEPMRWFFLSFADEHTFRGGVIIEACGNMHALESANRLGINPGGQVLFAEVPDDVPVPDAMKNRLLSRDELERLWGPPVRIDPDVPWVSIIDDK